MMPMPKFLWSNNPATDEQIHHMSSLYVPEYLKEMIENYDEWQTWINYVKRTQERGSAPDPKAGDKQQSIVMSNKLYVKMKLAPSRRIFSSVYFLFGQNTQI